MNNSNDYATRYFNEFFDLLTHKYYLDIYHQKSVNINRVINVFLAATSSSSICGWAIWNEFAFIWGGIIAISQLLTVIKQYVPYKQRLKFLGKVLADFEILQNDAEKKWFDVSEGKLTIKEINDLRFDIREKKSAILIKYIGNEGLPDQNKYMEQATLSAETYINNYYN